MKKTLALCFLLAPFCCDAAGFELPKEYCLKEFCLGQTLKEGKPLWGAYKTQYYQQLLKKSNAPAIPNCGSMVTNKDDVHYSRDGYTVELQYSGDVTAFKPGMLAEDYEKINSIVFRFAPPLKQDDANKIVVDLAAKYGMKPVGNGLFDRATHAINFKNFFVEMKHTSTTVELSVHPQFNSKSYDLLVAEQKGCSQKAPSF